MVCLDCELHVKQVFEGHMHTHTHTTHAHAHSEAAEDVRSRGGQAAEGSGIEARSGDQSARSAEKFFAFIFQLLGWALVEPLCFALMHQDHCCKVADESLLFIFSDFFPGTDQVKLRLTVNIIIT